MQTPDGGSGPRLVTRSRHGGIVGCAKSRAKILPQATMAGAILRTRSVAEIGYSPESAPNLAEIAAESAGNNPSCTCRWKLLYGHSQSPRHSCIERLSACAKSPLRPVQVVAPRGAILHTLRRLPCTSASGTWALSLLCTIFRRPGCGELWSAAWTRGHSRIESSIDDPTLVSGAVENPADGGRRGRIPRRRAR